MSSGTFSEALSSRRPNSVGFIRWVLAALVVVDHSFPISGLVGGSDPVWKWSKGQDSLGGLAVAGFFVISGFLVCRSYFGSGTARRFVWKRFLRIFPGYWMCLVVTAFVFAPLAWMHERGALNAAFLRGPQSPIHYLTANFFLHIHQWDIDRLLSHTPYIRSGYPVAWDGSLWTLIYEFKYYLFLALLGWAGLLRHRQLIAGLTIAFYLLMLSWEINPQYAAKLMPFFGDVYVARFGFLFMFGATLALYADRIVVDDRLGVLSGVIAVLTLHYGGWLLLGYGSLGYCLLWLAARLPMHWWDRVGDLSYGTYIYAFPIQMLLADHGLQRHGIVVFIIGSLLGATVLALLSWHLIEKRALSLKNIRPFAMSKRIRLGSNRRMTRSVGSEERAATTRSGH